MVGFDLKDVLHGKHNSLRGRDNCAVHPTIAYFLDKKLNNDAVYRVSKEPTVYGEAWKMEYPRLH